jgi:hypothetical protein
VDLVQADQENGLGLSVEIATRRGDLEDAVRPMEVDSVPPRSIVLLHHFEHACAVVRLILLGRPGEVEAAPNGVVPPTLYAMMMMECAVVAINGTRAHECDYCSNVYLVGALTKRRAKGLYCSDSCRVMGLRRRKEGKPSVE